MSSLPTAIAVAEPLEARIHEPTLIGEVTLNIRSMLRKRVGRPRSEMRSAGLETNGQTPGAADRIDTADKGGKNEQVSK